MEETAETHHDATEGRVGKKAYAAPRLTTFGAVGSMTQAGSGGMAERNSSSPNKRPGW